MYYVMKCLSDRNYVLRYPEFFCAEGARGKERRAVTRMNGFYDAMAKEAAAYCAELAAEHPRVQYSLTGEVASAAEGEAFAVTETIAVRVALTLRRRPEPTRRGGVVHRWQNGVLLGGKDSF